MKVIVTVTREYEMNEKRVLNQRDFDPPLHDAPTSEKREWLQESFYELCGFERDQDHVDGKFVWSTDEFGDTEFEWPKELR